MTPSPPLESETVGKRYWMVAVVVVILALSLLLSFDFGPDQFTADAWSNFISGVQISTLVVVLALVLLWARSRSR